MCCRLIRYISCLMQAKAMNEIAMWARTLETVQETSLGYAGGKPNPLNPPYQGDFPLNSPLIRGARGVKNDERWVSCTVSLEGVQ